MCGKSRYVIWFALSEFASHTATSRLVTSVVGLAVVESQIDIVFRFWAHELAEVVRFHRLTKQASNLTPRPCVKELELVLVFLGLACPLVTVMMLSYSP